ncbi:unnamed protein product [Porites evermanni]|uniref:Uncharacterized protein n=1 Tax=Porites evermanni TaxID=104178 RepID=A0ABN8SVK5_9CNID|nr:unnamed protein product [Porites evermanni]
MRSVESVCLQRGETLGDVVAQSCLFQRKKTFNGINVQELIWHVFIKVANELGVRKAFCELVCEELWNQRVQMLSVPDWMLLLCKLESTISDDSWQMILNRTRVGKSGGYCVSTFDLFFFSFSNSSDTLILLSKSNIKALRSMVFDKVRSLFYITQIQDFFS